MLFSSFLYLLFLPLVVVVYWVLRNRAGHRWPQIWLLSASLFFYAYGKPSNLWWLGASILFNWAVARRMMAQTGVDRRRRYLWLGLSVNVGLLFLFKYVNPVLGLLARWMDTAPVTVELGFPLGISFFTLTQIMYLVDAFPRAPESPAARKIYQGMLQPNSLFDHATFVTLFPYVIAGPVVKARSMVTQLQALPGAEVNGDKICRGLLLFSLGLAKKVVLADSFDAVAGAGFAAVGDYSMAEAWIFCLAALLHVYFDFSGYSDMAVGSAWMLGIDIPQNFNAPLLAKSISEFWQRWHISVSNFITEYLYKPLLRAMPKPTMAASAAATTVAMVIAALWHGPAWTFLAWGVTHGLALSINQWWKRSKRKMPDWMGLAITLIFVTSTFALLRAASLEEALRMISRLVPHSDPFGLSALAGILPLSPAVLLRPAALGVVAAFFFQTAMRYAETLRLEMRTALATAAAVIVSVLFLNSAPAKVFVYFAF